MRLGEIQPSQAHLGPGSSIGSAAHRGPLSQTKLGVSWTNWRAILPARAIWVFDPNSGGKKIPEAVRRRAEARLRRFAEANFAGTYLRLDSRFRGQFCYLDAYLEPELPAPNWPPASWGETREEYLDRLRQTPVQLGRLRYFGDEERWGFAFYASSSDRYELSVFPSGEFFGPPEDAFEAVAGAYLRSPLLNPSEAGQPTGD